jgi:DNA-binding transcriptional ArsR family regulator
MARQSFSGEVLIRIHLGSEGLGNVRVSAVPDFGAELTAAGWHYIRAPSRAAGLLRQLYSRSTAPDLDAEISQEYLSHLFARRSPTPFARALAEGDQQAGRVLREAVERLRREAVAANQPRISASVAARTAEWSQLAATNGASALLNSLRRDIQLRSGHLAVPTRFEADLELGPRALVIQAVALGRRVTLAEPAPDHLTVRVPIECLPQRWTLGHSALSSLLGTAKAEVLQTIVGTGGLTGRELAAALGVSDATASRHASVLRRAGLIQTRRAGQAVLHLATPLGYQLVGGTGRSTPGNDHPKAGKRSP